MNEQDEVRLRDMLDAARDGIAFVLGRTREDLESDRMLAYALVRAIEIVGEAASRVTSDTQARHPQIPWKNIIGTRHRVIHDYADVDLDIVWEIATARLPELVAELEGILPPSGVPPDPLPG